MSDKNIENEAIVTDQFALINGIVDLRMKAYVIFNASEHQETRKALKDLKAVVIQTSPKRVWVIVDNIATKIAIVILLLLIILGCTSSV